MAFVQDDRLIRMTQGPLGAGEVLLTSFSGREAISRLFQFQIEFVSTKLDLKASDLIGKDVTIEIDRQDVDGNAETPRYFHAYISRFAAGGVADYGDNDVQYRTYRAELVPWLWMLTQTARCFLYFPEKEDKTVYEIIEAVFKRAQGELSLQAAEFDLSGISDLQQRKVKHCAQYRETDFNFVSRIMEQFGAYYYFKHEDGKHTLFVSVKNNYPKCEEAEVTFPESTSSQSQTDHITGWEHSYEFVSGKWEHTDYNFETPSTKLNKNSPKIAPDVVSESSSFEVYDYPGEFANTGDSDKEARIRQEEEEASHNVVNGSGHCKTFMPGHTFELLGHPDQEYVSEHKEPYLVTSIQHSAVQAGPDSGEEQGAHYSNSFDCIPSALQYRPARTTPKPIVSGVQTAVVVGPSGEEIYTDEYGRVKVQFHWDREGQRDENTSCWIRVSQVHAGKGFGGIDIPRIDEEVIVSFEEGDPDRPLVTGRVYHKESMPPFGLPGAKTISGLKSNTHKGSGYNEFVMDDTAGNELMRAHAQFDMDTTVENDQRTTVHNNRTDKIDVDDSETVGANQTVNIGANQTIEVGADQKMTVKSNRDLKVSSNETIDIGSNNELTVGANRTASVGANDELTVSGAQKIGVAGAIEISSDTSITLTVGGSTIKIEPASVSIKSTKITIEGSAKVETQGAMITSQASGNHEIKGALVKIN